MKAFYFVKYFIEAYPQYFNKISECGAVFTFDLEDSIKDVTSNRKTVLLKQEYRDILITLFSSYSFLQKYSLAVRVNHPEGKEFVKDLAALQKLKFVDWNTIIIPKVESLETVLKVIADLNARQVKFKNVGILIESEEGFNQLSNIISKRPSFLKYIFFGHADYNLDCERLPFKHQNDNLYWHWIQRFSDIMSSEDLTFINSPCLYLKNDDLFLYNLQKLRKINFMNTGHLTLTLQQTLLCNKTSGLDNILPIMEGREKELSVKDYAEELIRIYHLQHSEKSFSITEDDYFICPQEYKMACEFLQSEIRYA